MGKHLTDLGRQVPDNYDELLSLPGVGPYAAGAYLSLHRDIRHIIIDSNVVRLYCRLIGRTYDGETRREEWLRAFAEQVTPSSGFKVYNYAVLDFSRAICTHKPDCNKCPLTSICATGSTSLDKTGNNNT